MSSRPPSPSPESIAAVLDRLQQATRPLQRDELRAATGLSDRAVREAVAELVEAGQPIVTARQGGGYYLTNRTDLIEAEVRTLASHEARLRDRRRALERHLDAQPGLFEEAS